MVSIAELWLPILLSGVFVFVASSIIHMVIPYHRSDYKHLPNEDQVLDSLRPHDIAPGEYFFPACKDMKEMQSEEMIQKWNNGPAGMMTIFPKGTMKMGKFLLQWFIFTLVISVGVAYVAGRSLAPGAEFKAVLQIAGTVAIMVYALANVNNSIWKSVRWGVTAKFFFDGVIYGLVTGLTMAWLWPQAAV